MKNCFYDIELCSCSLRGFPAIFTVGHIYEFRFKWGRRRFNITGQAIGTTEIDFDADNLLNEDADYEVTIYDITAGAFVAYNQQTDFIIRFVNCSQVIDTQMLISFQIQKVQTTDDSFNLALETLNGIHLAYPLYFDYYNMFVYVNGVKMVDNQDFTYTSAGLVSFAPATVDGVVPNDITFVFIKK